jgi:hypothetical protein
VRKKKRNLLKALGATRLFGGPSKRGELFKKSFSRECHNGQ